jgi:hypothetical protein
LSQFGLADTIDTLSSFGCYHINTFNVFLHPTSQAKVHLEHVSFQDLLELGHRKRVEYICLEESISWASLAVNTLAFTFAGMIGYLYLE